MFESRTNKFFCRTSILIAALLFYSSSFCQIEVIEAPQVTKFDSIYTWNVPPVESRKVHDSILDRIKSDEAFWYVNMQPAKKKNAVQQRESIFERSWFKNMMWFIVIVGFIVILVWYLASSNINLFRRKPIVVESDEDGNPEDIFSINYEREIARAIETGNLRLAIRMNYLSLLSIMSDRGIINYTHERTNSDYLFQLAGTKYYNDFFRVTRYFEYTWYGKIDLPEPAFVQVQNDFIHLKQQLQ